MLRNGTSRNFPSWAQQLMEELLKPPGFMTNSPQEPKPTASHSVTPTTHRDAKKSTDSASQHSTTTTYKTRDARPTPSSSVPREISHPSQRKSGDRTAIEPPRLWRAALIRSDIPESALYSYGWDILDVHRVQNVVRVETDDGDFALKNTHASAKHVKFLRKAMSYAREHGFDRFADIVNASTGKPYVLDGSNVYYASRWIKGAEANFSSARQVGRVAQSLAEWHESTRGFNPEGYRPDPEFAIHRMLKSRGDDLRRMLASAAAKETPDAFDSTFLSLGENLRKDIEKSLRLVAQPSIATFLKQDAKGSGLCHLDVIPSNFIFDREERFYLIDLDLATYAPRALDLAHLLRRSLERSNWNTEVAYAVFYHYNEVREIESAEYAVVQALLTFPYRVWRLAHIRYHVLSEGSQVDSLQAASTNEARRRAFIDSYARQIPQPEE